MDRFLPVLLFWMVACTSDAHRTSHDSTSHVDAGVIVDGAAITDAPSERTQPTDAPQEGGACSLPSDASPDAICVESVAGRLVDESGAPAVAGVLVTACGAVQCEPGLTDDIGRFTIPVNRWLAPTEYSVIPHGRPYKAGFYFPLPVDQPGPDLDLGDLPFLTMPSTGPLIDINRDGTPAQSVTSGDVTLDIPDGIYVRLDVESYAAGDDGRMFRALRVPDALLSRFVPPSLGVLAAYALEPFESQFEVPVTKELVDVRLSFDNALQLPAATPVEFLALGNYLHPDWVTPARFEPVATGQVTADGSRIDFAAGQGIRYLTWVAIRATLPP
jgi:hypothetical protein